MKCPSVHHAARAATIQDRDFEITMARPKTIKNETSANVGYEAQLWQIADALRGSMDAGEYKHVALGLLFLKYISDAFDEQHAKLESEIATGADPKDPANTVRSPSSCTSLSCRSSPAQKGRRAASSTRPAASSSSWLK
jgi:hypothetical protein